MPNQGAATQGDRTQKVSEKRGARNVKATTRRLVSLVFRAYPVAFFVVLVCVILSSLATVAGSLFLRTLIDDYITPMIQAHSTDFGPLLQAILKMGIIYLFGIAATISYQLLMVQVSQGTMKTVRDKLFSHMQRLPVRYFDTHSHGDVMSRYTNDTDTLRQMISQSMPQLFAAIITVLAVLSSMVVLAPLLALVVVVFLALMLIASGKLVSGSGRFFVAQQASLGNVNGYIEEIIHGQKVVKVFCHEQQAQAVFDEKNELLCANATKANRYSNIIGPVNGNLGYLQYVVIAVAGGAFALNGVGSITLGIIASFLQLSRSISTPIAQVSQQLNTVVMAIAGAERIFEVMDEPIEQDDGLVTLVNVKEADGLLQEVAEHTGLWAWRYPHSDGIVTYERLLGDVRLFDVDFGYDPQKPVLHDITLYAKPGQKLAFVGATGAGKTTITNLLNRFYDIADGKIRYDGININRIKKADLRKSLGMVLQDTSLFSGTVADNIRFGKPDATQDEVIAAAKLAHADGFIQLLPNGYETVIDGDGAGLSQGQRQLLAIARAAIADPPVMILDEATSSIDTRTEAIVQRGMDELMKGRTVFVIAHRLSTVRNADAIMVLDHGRIIERGSHQELISQKGQYYQLYTGAFELE